MDVVQGPVVTLGFKTDAADCDIAVLASANGKQYLKFHIGAGATSSAGGEIAVGETYTLRFKVRAAAIPGSVSNTARIIASSESGAEFTDDGTAIIGPDGGPLDVKLSSFTATLQNPRTALLKWATESELNHSHFIVQRSEDGVNFEDRGTVMEYGPTSHRQEYSFTDYLNTAARIIYYRLESVDNRGKGAYSKIIALRLDGSMMVNEFSVYPNPFVDHIKMTVNASGSTEATVRVVAFDGREMMNRKVKLSAGDNIVVLNDFSRMPIGSYVLEVTSGSEKFIRRIIKK